LPTVCAMGCVRGISMTSHPIRRATAEDAAPCAAILSAWIDGTDWMPRTISDADLVDALRTGLPLREAYVIGAPVLGYLSLDQTVSHIWGFYVGKPGQGLGRALLNRAKENRTFLQLNTHHANTSAHRFYKREGFIQVGDPWRGDDGIDEITMEWRA